MNANRWTSECANELDVFRVQFSSSNPFCNAMVWKGEEHQLVAAMNRARGSRINCHKSDGATEPSFHPLGVDDSGRLHCDIIAKPEGDVTPRRISFKTATHSTLRWEEGDERKEVRGGRRVRSGTNGSRVFWF